MDLASVDTFWLIAGLVLVNVFLVAILRTENRFWHPPIIVWLALLFTLLLLQADFGWGINRPSAPADNQARINNNAEVGAGMQLAQEEEREGLYKTKTFRLLGVQGFLALFLLTVGYQKTGLITYRKAAVSFVVVCLVYIVLEILFLLHVFRF